MKTLYIRKISSFNLHNVVVAGVVAVDFKQVIVWNPK